MIMKISALFANKRTRVIVIVAAVVLVLAILTPILLYAGGYIMPFDADGTPSARLLNTIKRDLAFAWSISSGGITIHMCGGSYNGCVPIMFSSSDVDPIDSVTIVDGVVIPDKGDCLAVWRYGKIYSFSEAYENKWLSREDLKKIRDIFETFERR